MNLCLLISDPNYRLFIVWKWELNKSCLIIIYDNSFLIISTNELFILQKTNGLPSRPEDMSDIPHFSEMVPNPTFRKPKPKSVPVKQHCSIKTQIGLDKSCPFVNRSIPWGTVCKWCSWTVWKELIETVAKPNEC